MNQHSSAEAHRAAALWGRQLCEAMRLLARCAPHLGPEARPPEERKALLADLAGFARAVAPTLLEMEAARPG